ncbi:MAG: hypothetical protein R2698_12255 [Microthrixaceae bacterium]
MYRPQQSHRTRLLLAGVLMATPLSALACSDGGSEPSVTVSPTTMAGKVTSDRMADDAMSTTTGDRMGDDAMSTTTGDRMGDDAMSTTVPSTGAGG